MDSRFKTNGQIQTQITLYHPAYLTRGANATHGALRDGSLQPQPNNKGTRGATPPPLERINTKQIRRNKGHASNIIQFDHFIQNVFEKSINSSRA